MNAKEIVLNIDRYKGFIILDDPRKFKEISELNCLQKPIVQLHDMTSINNGKDIIGFCGVTMWENGKLIPLDGDNYDSDMLIYGYNITHIKDNFGSKILVDILIKEW